MAKVNMKLPKKSKKDMEEAKVVDMSYENRERYPYGLEVRLEDESLKKLGLSATGHKVKDKVSIGADAYVESTHCSQRSDGSSNESMTLQITDLEVAPQAKQDSGSQKFAEYNKVQNEGPGEGESY